MQQRILFMKSPVQTEVLSVRRHSCALRLGSAVDCLVVGGINGHSISPLSLQAVTPSQNGTENHQCLCGWLRRSRVTAFFNRGHVRLDKRLASFGKPPWSPRWCAGFAHHGRKPLQRYKMLRSNPIMTRLVACSACSPIFVCSNQNEKY